ncbi:DUF3387 domain-containing protein [Stieleria sp. JC731]|uniref:DUF3387 domain-containing protein n=1 Tax=Pirellulaceae TaxID=2691357 RepID=UPI001E447ED3|nr:DUF3387 domain-containing protein [Stieleria sp. JC731]MCC9602078.1 DUF3387 domain-containing protein [Stieleria sp. JC731]
MEDERNDERSEVLDDFSEEIIDLIHLLKAERASFGDLGIRFEQQATYDIKAEKKVGVVLVLAGHGYPRRPRRCLHPCRELQEASQGSSTGLTADPSDKSATKGSPVSSL